MCRGAPACAPSEAQWVIGRTHGCDPTTFTLGSFFIKLWILTVRRDCRERLSYENSID